MTDLFVSVFGVVGAVNGLVLLVAVNQGDAAAAAVCAGAVGWCLAFLIWLATAGPAPEVR